MKETLSRFTSAFDAIATEAAHSDNKYDVSVMLALLESVVRNAEVPSAITTNLPAKCAPAVTAGRTPAPTTGYRSSNCCPRPRHLKR